MTEGETSSTGPAVCTVMVSAKWFRAFGVHEIHCATSKGR